MISVEKALKIILKEVCVKRIEEVNIMSSLGRVLAKDIVSKYDVPPFKRAAMDGYAVKSKDVEKASFKNPVILRVIDDLPAGKIPQKKVREGESIRIMTGAPMPDGADSVVMVEDTESANNTVRIFRRVEIGINVSEKGEDVKKGELIIRKCKKLRPSEIGMFANLGISKVKVYSKSIVSIIATGDELVEVNEKIGKNKIRNSNSYSIAGQVIKAGGIPNILGIARDNEKDILRKIKESKKSDILILSGGVSVGVYDLVKKVLEDFGVNSLFWKVNIKPGKPVFFGVKDKQLVFGLPGYPVSSMLTFELFVRPCILKMSGNKSIYRDIVEAILEEDIQRKPGRREFMRAKIKLVNGKYYAKPTGPQGSGILKSLVLADCLIIVPEKISKLKKGSKVNVMLI